MDKRRAQTVLVPAELRAACLSMAPFGFGALLGWGRCHPATGAVCLFLFRCWFGEVWREAIVTSEDAHELLTGDRFLALQIAAYLMQFEAMDT